MRHLIFRARQAYLSWPAPARVTIGEQSLMANRQIASALAFILTAFGWGNVMAASQPHRHVTADLIAGTSAAVPGKTLTVAVRERMEPGWHTYWANPGDSGRANLDRVEFARRA